MASRTPAMEFINQTFTFPPCPKPSKRPAEATTTDAEASPTTFMFVHSQKGQVPKKVRQPMRSHVMQQARSKRKWSTSKGVVNTPRPNSLELSDDSPAFAELPMVTLAPFAFTAAAAATTADDSSPDQASASPRQDSKPSHLPPAPYDLVGPDAPQQDPNLTTWDFLDPYACLPVRLCASERSMLDLYLRSLDQCFTPAGQKQSSAGQAWFAAAFASRAFMYSLLCAAATQMCALGQTSYFAVLQYKSATITELNKSIGDPILGAADDNIAAVFNLLCVDETFPLPNHPNCSTHDLDGVAHRRVHLQGLKKMLQVRGGLMSLRTNPSLYKFLLWYATTHSIASFQRSELSPNPEELLSALEDSLPPSDTETKHDEMVDIMQTCSMSQSLISAAQQMTTFVHHCNACNGNFSSFTGIAHESDLVVQSLLHELLRQTGQPFDPVAEALYTAMIMFTVRATSDPTPPLDSLHFAATRWLRHALLHASDDQWDLRIRLWTTTVGAVCAQGSREAMNIETEFARACRDSKVDSCEVLLKALRNLIWIERRFADSVKFLWIKTEHLVREH